MRQIGLGLLLAAVLTGAGWAALNMAKPDSPIDTLLSLYTRGNLHELIGSDAIDLIRAVGQEPDDYKYYSTDHYIFTYGLLSLEEQPTERTGVVSFAFVEGEASKPAQEAAGRKFYSIWEARIAFFPPIPLDEVLTLLGYSKGDFYQSELSQSAIRLGSKPYRTLEAALPTEEECKWTKSGYVERRFRFLQDHLNDNIWLVIVE